MGKGNGIKLREERVITEREQISENYPENWQHMLKVKEDVRSPT